MGGGINMCCLYITEQGIKLGVTDNRLLIEKAGIVSQEYPMDNVDEINLFGGIQLTEKCAVECMRRNIPVAYFSRNGGYYGRLNSLMNGNAKRQRLQARLYDSQFAIDFGRRLIYGKIHNQMVVLQRYSRSTKINTNYEQGMMMDTMNRLIFCLSYKEIMGQEGIAAKYYFQGLSKVIGPKFLFVGRSKRPPLDPVNSMLSLGYNMLAKEIQGKIEQKGLNPYFGLLHRDRENHPTLVSDIMEEWRAAIVDSTVLSLVNGHEIDLVHFYTSTEDGGVYMNKEGMDIFFRKVRKKMDTCIKYLDYVDYRVTFRYAMDLQLMQFIKAMEDENVAMYTPITLR